MNPVIEFSNLKKKKLPSFHCIEVFPSTVIDVNVRKRKKNKNVWNMMTKNPVANMNSEINLP